MPNIYSYLDYRQFLEDFYKEKKKKNPKYSYQVIANIAGFKAKSYFKGIIDGSRNLTTQSIPKMNKVLKLTDKQFAYFCDLVAFNHEKKNSVKSILFQKLLEYNQNNKAKIILAHQYDFYEKWYHHVIREIIEHVDFKEDYNLLANLVKPKISIRQARHSVSLLEKLRIIKRDENGLRQNDEIISTGDEVQSVAIGNFHLQNLMLAGESIDTVPSVERDISNLILGLSDEGIPIVKKEIQKFRKKLLAIAEQQKNVSRVYNVSFQMFPMSEVLNENK